MATCEHMSAQNRFILKTIPIFYFILVQIVTFHVTAFIVNFFKGFINVRTISMRLTSTHF